MKRIIQVLRPVASDGALILRYVWLFLVFVPIVLVAAVLSKKMK